MTDLTEGVVTNAEPTCAMHGTIPGGHGGDRPWPAHTMERGHQVPMLCRGCGQEIDGGDRYVCIEGGIKHLTCPAYDPECSHDWMLRPESDTAECLICGDER